MVELSCVLLAIAFGFQSWVLCKLLHRIRRLEDIAHEASVKLGVIDYV